MKKIILSLFITGLFFYAQGQFFFSPKQEISDADHPEAITTADFNNDGYADVVYSSINDNKIAISLFSPSEKKFDNEIIISSQFGYVVSLYTADLNNDDFIDILAVSQTADKIIWFKNIDGTNFQIQDLINNDAQGASAVIAADIDNDNDFDVISASKDDSKILWYKNTDGNGTFSAPQIITDQAELPSCLAVADVDNDNDIDIFAGYLLSDKIVWFENLDGSGSFSQEIQITTQTDNIMALFTADLNNDGYADIVSASKNDNKIAWYENLASDGGFSDQIIISDQITQAYDVFAEDFDLDSDFDIIASSLNDNSIILFENDSLNFENQYTINNLSENVKQICAADFDYDGDIDIAAAASNDDKIFWYQNAKSAFKLHTINKTAISTDIQTYDIDFDGDMDIFYSDHYNVYFLENINYGQSFEQTTLSQISYNIYNIKLVDIDSDNDADLVVADAQGDKVFWLENTNGYGNFSSENIIDNTCDGPITIDTADLNNDNYIDLLCSAVNGNEIIIYDNLGNGNFNKRIIIDTISIYASAFLDVNNDNYKDIIYSSSNKLTWLQNDGTGNFPSDNIFSDTSSYSWLIKLADLNNDNYKDIIYTPNYDLNILKNNQDATFDEENIYSYYTIMDFDYADLDNDNDLEILMAQRSADKVNWLENFNNADSFALQLPVNVISPQEIAVADINNDNYTDIVIGSWPDEAIYWAENYAFKILNQPFNPYACLDEPIFFSIIATGVEQYQWQMDEGSGFSDISNNATFDGTNKAKLSILNVDESLIGNQFRCLIYDKNSDNLISDTATLYQYAPSVECIENQSRNADSSNTYTVIGDEFAPEDIYNKCQQDLTLENDYNNSNSLESEVFDPGTYTIKWYLKNSEQLIIDSCDFEVTINEYVNISENNIENIRIYPNPAKDIIRVKAGVNINSYSIFNLTGKKVLFENIDSDKTDIDISALQKGVYFLIISTDKKCLSFKIIKI